MSSGARNASPAAHHVPKRQFRGCMQVQPNQSMQVVIQDRESRDDHRDELRQFLGPMFDPASGRASTPLEGPPQKASHAVIPAGHRSMNLVAHRAIVMGDFLG